MSLVWLPLLVACVDWAAVYWDKRRWGYLTKPGVMAAILGWMGYAVWSRLPEGAGWAAMWAEADGWGWFALGIVFSLFGDVFLMLPEERFVPGLVSFLLAHLAYIVGFNLSRPPLDPALFVLVLVVGLTGIRVYRRIRAGLLARGKTRLQVPVMVYSTLMGVMLLSALMTLVRSEQEWGVSAALWVSAGAMLFFISDVLLAWNRFVAPVSQARIKVRITYHLGQLALIVGSGMHFLS